MRPNRLCIILLFVASISAAQLRFAWDPPAATNGITGYHLWSGTNEIYTSALTEELSGFVVGPIYVAAVKSVASGLESTAAATTTVRLVRMTLEASDFPSGPWASETNWIHAISPVRNAFYRMRLDWQ